MKKKLKIIIKLGYYLKCHLNLNMPKAKYIFFIDTDICAKILLFLETIYIKPHDHKLL